VRSRKTLFTAAMAAATLATLFVILQVLGGVYLWRKYGRIAECGAIRSEIELQPREKPVSKIGRLHPYWGFTIGPDVRVKDMVSPEQLGHMTHGPPYPDWVSLEVNNHGFFSRRDYPVPNPAKDKFIVGVFGGSVAKWLSLQGEQALRETLESHLGADREVVVLNFARGAFKQPQQLMVLSYFQALGQDFDAVVNLDGFNEAVLPLTRNCKLGSHVSLPADYPVSSALFTQLSLGDERAVAWMADLARAGRRWRAWTERRNAARLSSVAFVADLLSTYYGKRVAYLERATPEKVAGEESVFFLLPPDTPCDGSPAEEEVFADLWFRCSVLMAQQAESGHAIYLHVLQPNQHHSGKTLSEDETAVLAGGGNGAYRQAVERAYPLFREKGARLRSLGIDFVDATGVFDSETGTVYSDGCCHYNDHGNELLARLIAGEIIRRLQEREAPAPGENP